MRLFLTKRGEYGIRLLIHLAQQPRDRRMTAGELAEVCEIPAGNVPTIVNILSRAGILVCSPGRGGGCTLAREPSDIAMLETVVALEGPFELTRCVLDSRRCFGRDPECAVHNAWTAGRDAAIDALGRTTLADAVARQREIERQAKRRARSATR
ncbi:MAG: Rrf2 family transcriptional regulator [Acidimicrobiia bacterium]|nr:Rrf2 family transcriptional regulator [Acidimicrobiia bacterium]